MISGVQVIHRGPRGAVCTYSSRPASHQSAMLELANGVIAGVTSEKVGQAFESGDAMARAVLAETSDLLTPWLGNIIGRSNDAEGSWERVEPIDSGLTIQLVRCRCETLGIAWLKRPHPPLSLRERN